MARAKKTKGASAERPGLADPTAPLDGRELLAAARPVLQLLREDLGKRAEDVRVDRALRTRYEDEKAARRTADSFAEWRDGLLAQVAASWFLSCVFVRTLEDRGLLGQVRIAGPGATDSQTLFFQLAPSLTERDYLLFVFRELAELPAAGALFDREHAMVWQLSPSADAAKELLRLFRTPSAEEPAFRFGQPSTRFLGDLYQDLYEDVRKRYALLQTPDFIESFILDRTLEPAIERFGLDDTTLIDPTCGSGHFLLGAFDRLFEHRLRAKPGIDVRQAAHQALDAVYGADINPYAVAIARVRLTLSYLEKAVIRRLKDAPALPLHLVVADSLLYNPQHAQLAFEHQEGQSTAGWRAEPFQLEDPAAARDVLHRQYAAVVGNPPYITEKDSAKRETYRAMYPRSAAGKYALSAPFCERFFQLARERGSVGQITANSFMKREFGKKLIEDFLKNLNLEIIVNTSGAYIPGHGTPTVLLFGTHEAPVRREVLSILAKRGEPSTPTDPAKGLVWSSIAAHWRDLGFDNDYITVATSDRNKLASHPWSLGGGGALELKELLEERVQTRLSEMVEDIGFASFTGLDDAFILPAHTAKTFKLEPEFVRPMIVGESVRDWAVVTGEFAVTPYDRISHQALPLSLDMAWGRFLWRYRSVAQNVSSFGGRTREQEGQNWWEWYRWQAERYSCSYRIVFADVATHNHFVLDRGDKVFNRTAPIIKLPAKATEDDHLALLAYLNSSTTCFWMKQVCFDKGNRGEGGGFTSEEWEKFYQFNASNLLDVPVPAMTAKVAALGADRARRLLAAAQAAHEAADLRPAFDTVANLTELDQRLNSARVNYDACLRLLRSEQEALDWWVYSLIGLAHPKLAELSAEARASDVLFAHKVMAGEPGARYFTLCRLPAPSAVASSTAPPEHLAAIQASPELAMLEHPTFKRTFREGFRPIDAFAQARSWIAERAESVLDGSREPQPMVTIVAGIGEHQSTSVLLEWLRATHQTPLDGIVQSQSVPYLAAYRHTETGMRKYGEWRALWEQQRDEDRGGP